MAKRIWEIKLDSKTHLVQVIHGYWSGKREIMVDGKLVVKGHGINASGQSHTFSIGEHYCELHIATNGFVYRYILFIDGTPHIAKNDNPKDTIIHAAIKDASYWHMIAKLTGLRYVPAPQARGIWRHRLVGSIDGYLFAVRLGSLEQGPILAASVVVRFAPIFSPEELKFQLNNDPTLNSLIIGATSNKFDITESQLWAGLVYTPLKESAELFAKKLKDLASVLSKYVSPMRGEACDSFTCKNKWEQSLLVAFVNETPLLLCQECINDVPNWGRKAKEEYKQAPAGLVKGILAGLGIATLGALGWAIFAVVFERVVAVLGAAIFISIVKIMDKVGTKRTVSSILIAALIAVGGVFVGSYLTVLWLVARESLSAITSFEALEQFPSGLSGIVGR